MFRQSKYLYPVIKTVFIFLPVVSFLGANAQSKIIEEVFKLLPAGQVYNLTVVTRDSMLNGKTYYPADNDSNFAKSCFVHLSPYCLGSNNSTKFPEGSIINICEPPGPVTILFRNCTPSALNKTFRTAVLSPPAGRQVSAWGGRSAARDQLCKSCLTAGLLDIIPFIL